MNEAREIIGQIERRLIKLGYPESAISTQVATRSGERVDLAVYEQDKCKIVIEIKTGANFPDRVLPQDLQFNPAVRRAQSYARELSAPYYILTDGRSDLWFATDEMGRPFLLKEPVRASADAGIISTRASKATIAGIFHELWELQVRSVGSTSSDGPAIAVYAKLLSERGNDHLQNSLRRFTGEYEELRRFFPDDLPISRGHDFGAYYEEAFSILDRVSLTGAPAESVLGALDGALVGRSSRMRSEVRIPRWLTDFLIRIAQPNPGDTILDMYSTHGDVLAAAALASLDAEVWTISSSRRAHLWAQIQQLVFGSEKPGIALGDAPPVRVFKSSVFPSPQRIIAIPPFGRRFRVYEYEFTLGRHESSYSEDVYLELALQWADAFGRVVALVPDGLLFAANREYARRFLLGQARLTAVISLGNFLPGSGLRASAIVLDKGIESQSHYVFMARINPVDASGTFTATRLPKVAKVLEAFQQWTTGQHLEHSADAWTTRFEDLTIENLTVDRYLPSQDSTLAGAYQRIVPLAEVVEIIFRGTSIKLEDGGDVPVIGPAAIRPMVLDIDAINATSSKNLKSNARPVQESDVVVNLIGTHLGEAAVVQQGLTGVFPSQHVLVIRPKHLVVLSDYLAVALNSGFVRRQFDAAATGAVIPALSTRSFREITIPLPDMEMQADIVKKITADRDAWLQAEDTATRLENRFRENLQNLGKEGKSDEPAI